MLRSTSGSPGSQVGVSHVVSNTSKNTRPRKIRSSTHALPTLPRIAASVMTWFSLQSRAIAAIASRTAASEVATAGKMPLAEQQRDTILDDDPRQRIPNARPPLP